MKTAPPGWLPDTGAETEALIKEARRRQRRRYLLTGVAALVVLAGVAGVTVSQMGRAGGRLAIAAPHRRMGRRACLAITWRSSRATCRRT